MREQKLTATLTHTAAGYVSDNDRYAERFSRLSGMEHEGKAVFWYWDKDGSVHRIEHERTPEARPAYNMRLYQILCDCEPEAEGAAFLVDAVFGAADTVPLSEESLEEAMTALGRLIPEEIRKDVLFCDLPLANTISVCRPRADGTASDGAVAVLRHPDKLSYQIVKRWDELQRKGFPTRQDLCRLFEEVTAKDIRKAAHTAPPLPIQYLDPADWVGEPLIEQALLCGYSGVTRTSMTDQTWRSASMAQIAAFYRVAQKAPRLWSFNVPHDALFEALRVYQAVNKVSVLSEAFRALYCNAMFTPAAISGFPLLYARLSDKDRREAAAILKRAVGLGRYLTIMHSAKQRARLPQEDAR